MAHSGGPLAAIVTGARQWQRPAGSVGHHTGPAERFDPSSKSRIVLWVVDLHVFTLLVFDDAVMDETCGFFCRWWNP